MTTITIINAEDAFYGMGDAQANNGNDGRIYMTASKLFIKSGMILGVSGEGADVLMIQYRFGFPEHPEGVSALEYLAGYFVEPLRCRLREEDRLQDYQGGKIWAGVLAVGYMGELFRIDSSFDVTQEPEQYIAVGSGYHLAKGSLFTTEALGGMLPEHRLELALEAARRFDVGTGWPDGKPPEVVRLPNVDKHEETNYTQEEGIGAVVV